MPEHEIERDGVALSVSDDGEGTPVVLLHGLTASRRYVVMGSKALERSDHRVVAYDARGHGRSSAANAPDDYGYDALAADLQAVLDGLGLDRAVLAGASMGAHTIVRFALGAPDRVAGLCLITPAFVPDRDADLAHWDALADGLRDGGIDGFVAAYPLENMPEAWRKTVEQVVRQRLAQHDPPHDVAGLVAATRQVGRRGGAVFLAPVPLAPPGRDVLVVEHPADIGGRVAGS